MMTFNNNTTLRKCKTCKDIAYNGSKTCFKCSQDSASSNDMSRKSAAFFILKLMGMGVLNAIALVSALGAVILFSLSLLVFMQSFNEELVIIPMIITMFFAGICYITRSEAVALKLRLKEVVRTKFQNRSTYTATPATAKDTPISTKKINKAMLNTALIQTEFAIGKLKRARSTQSILKLTDQAREQIASNAIVLKASQAKMQKVELEAANEQLKCLMNTIELKLLDQMQEQ